MNFIQIQIIIFFSIFFSSLIIGKKALFISSIIWVIETCIVYNVSATNRLQLITLSVSFQIGLVVVVIRDFILSKIKKNKNNQINEG